MKRLPACATSGTRQLHSGRLRVRRQQRAGVSLLEVLFSIGIVMIGLVGIASLIPVGGALARRGVIADAAAQMSSNGEREFSTRGMAIPSTWRWHNGTTWITPLLTGTNIPQPGTSFCLDPRFITAPDPALTAAQLTTELAARNKFPVTPVFGDTSVIWMPRITLGKATSVLSQLAANEIFVGSDELIFDLPSDRTLGPVQNFSFQDPTSVNPLKRNTVGTLSWMATIVPKLDRIQNTDSPTGMNPTDEYTLSIVVFDRRLVARELYDTTSGNLVSENLLSERVVRVAQFYSGTPAFSGGDMTLTTRLDRGPDDLELRSGDWVMFSGQKAVVNANAAPVGFTTIHKWYRVVNVDEEPVPVDPSDPATLYTRDITVVGPDWDVANIPTTQVTIARGVVEVHEKTIRLETSSMWLN